MASSGVSQAGGSGLSKEIVAVDRGGNADFSRTLVVLNPHNLPLARHLDGSRTCQFRRKRHGELDLGVFANVTVHVKEHTTGAHIASLGMYRGIRVGEPEP